MLDDLCAWLGGCHAVVDARFRDVAASSSRSRPPYGRPPLQLNVPLDALGEPSIGDGLVGWIDGRCSSAFPSRRGPDTAWTRLTPPRGRTSGDEAPEYGRSEEALAIALATNRPSWANVGTTDATSRPIQEGIAGFLTTSRSSGDGEALATSSAPWARFDRLETESDGWPPGTVVGISGPPGNATQVVFRLGDTIVNLSADDPGADEVLEGWALDIAWDLHSNDGADQ